VNIVVVGFRLFNILLAGQVLEKSGMIYRKDNK